MNAMWIYFWPCFAIGLIIGTPAGLIAFRRRSKRIETLAIPLVGALLVTLCWHGPLRGADRFDARVQNGISRTLVYYEMTQVAGHLHHGPLTRHVILSGPADEFQRSELVRLMNQVPGVESTSWSGSGEGKGVPLVAEGETVCLLGFLLGLLLAYLVELRRRYNAQWNW